jgi:hypothetical protein
MPIKPTKSDPLSMELTLISMSHRLAMNRKLRKTIMTPDLALETSAEFLVLTFCLLLELPDPKFYCARINNLLARILILHKYKPDLIHENSFYKISTSLPIAHPGRPFEKRAR